MSVSRQLSQPKLLLEITSSRRPYLRRFRFLLVILVMAIAAWFALEMAAARVPVDPRALLIGQLAAAAIILLVSMRAVVNLLRWRSRPNETIRLFNRGFTWERDGQKLQYSWGKLHTFREGGRGLYIGKRPIVQWGALTLTMSDKRVYKLRPRHGNLRQIARIIRPYAAEVTGIHMGRRLRQEKPVRVHPRLVVWPGGLQIGKEEIPWRVLNVTVKGSRLIVQARDKRKVRTVRRYRTYTVDNLGGFMELATTTIRNHRQSV